MSYLAETILSTAQAMPEGGLLSAKEFLHLASRAAVDQTLARLTRQGKLMRIGRGAYSAPVVSRFGVRPAGMAIRAPSWLGPEQAPSALKMLHAQLPPAEWAATRSARAVLPS